MIYYSVFCLTFGIVFYIKYTDVNLYNSKLDWLDIFGMLICSIMSPILVTIALTVWCNNQIKKL